MNVTRLSIPRADGSILPTFLFSPAREGTLPCLVYFHGGGFALRAAPYHYELAKAYAKGSECRVLFVDYRLAPKYPFPAATEDAFTAYSYLTTHAAALGVDTLRIAVGGDSAGGSLAAGCALMTRECGLAMPCFHMLIYPVLDRRMETDSMAAYPDTPMWNAVKNRAMWEMYLSEKTGLPVEYASLLEAASLLKLPPAYIETAQFDCLHDEGVAYAKRLHQAGIAVELHETQSTVHGFDIIKNSALVKAWVKRRIQALRRAFD